MEEEWKTFKDAFVGAAIWHNVWKRGSHHEGKPNSVVERSSESNLRNERGMEDDRSDQRERGTHCTDRQKKKAARRAVDKAKRRKNYTES